MKKWLYLISIMLFFVANTNAANSDFLGVSEGVVAKTSTNVLSEGELLRTENAATRIGKPITVVGSRTKGTAGAYSDCDYVIHGLNSKNWSTIKNS